MEKLLVFFSKQNLLLSKKRTIDQRAVTCAKAFPGNVIQFAQSMIPGDMELRLRLTFYREKSF